MKVLFLDIDGVLNGYNFWSYLGWNIACKLNIKNWYKKHTRAPFGIHEEKIRRLAEIVKRTGCKVVMSSSWRFGWWQKPYEELCEDQRQLTDMLNKYNIEITDITPRSQNGRRDVEILSWLHDHQYEIESFVVIDDECSDLDCFICQGRLVQTSSIKGGQIIKGHWKENTGLKKKHVKLAVQILNKRKLCGY